VERSPYAPIIYKTITFSLIENHQNINLREFIMQNMIYVFRNVTSIPVGIMIVPLIKQIHISNETTYQLNVFDFEFLRVVASHSRLTLGHGIKLLDILAKIYT